MNPIVVTYQARFRDAFRELNLQWIERHFQVEKKDVEQVSHPEECIRAGGQIFFVLKESEAVGTCALYRLSSDRYELAKMAVRPDLRGLGLGDLLMGEAERWAREHDATEIMILSNTILTAAVSLYRKHGYEVVRLGPHPDYDRCNIEMRKRLKQDAPE